VLLIRRQPYLEYGLVTMSSGAPVLNVFRDPVGSAAMYMSRARYDRDTDVSARLLTEAQRSKNGGQVAEAVDSDMSGAMPSDAAAHAGRPSWGPYHMPMQDDGFAAARDRSVQRAVKRTFDIVGSVVLILLTLPLALLVVVAIALDSPGPTFFVHVRVGRDGVLFPLLKFRTMVRDAEGALMVLIASNEKQLVEWQTSRKLSADPRVTRVGRFLRRFSIDELPQLVNVVRGNMSLVGPRPVTREEVFDFGERAKRVLSVRPGLTGLWAVSGRSNLTYEERVEREFQYADGWSLWMDAKILVKTIAVVLRGHGAY